jgi:hypothetical protein
MKRAQSKRARFHFVSPYFGTVAVLTRIHKVQTYPGQAYGLKSLTAKVVTTLSGRQYACAPKVFSPEDR